MTQQQVRRGRTETGDAVGRHPGDRLGHVLRRAGRRGAGRAGRERHRLTADRVLGGQADPQRAVLPPDVDGRRLEGDGRLPLGERHDVVEPVGGDQRGDDLLRRLQAGGHTGPEALDDDPVDLVEHLLAVVRGQGEQPPPAHPLDHLVAQPAPQEPVTQRSRLGVFLDDVERLAEVLEVAARVEALEARVGRVVTLDVVVADVVAEHGDVVRAQERLRDEDVVLQAPPALGEAQTDVVEEGPAEHLVRGEAVDQRGVLDGGARMVAAEQLHRHRAPLARHLADDHVGAVGDSVVVHPLQGLVAEVVVVVDEHHVLALGGGDPHVAWLARPAGVLLVDDRHQSVLGGHLVQAGGCLVGGTVVDEDHFVFVGRQ